MLAKDGNTRQLSHYESFVADGHTDYLGKDDYKILSPAKYDDLTIANDSNTEQFRTDIKAHQQGKTDYLTFCNDCAKSGIEKWVVDIENMTCTYYGKARDEVLVEHIAN